MTDSTWLRHLDRLQDDVDGWVKRLIEPPLIETDSDLFKDDLVFPGFPQHTLAWWAIGVATEHLNASLRLLELQIKGGGSLLPSANFTVLRAAMVAASQAVVLLMPDSRLERTTSGLQLAHEELTQSLKFRQMLLDAPALTEYARSVGQASMAAALGPEYLRSLTEGRSEVERLLDERGVKPYKLTDTDVITRASALVHADDEYEERQRLSVAMEWRLGSGSAHGRLLMALNRPNGYTEVGPGRVAPRTDLETVALAAASAGLTLNAAWWALEQRRVVSPNGGPPPTLA